MCLVDDWVGWVVDDWVGWVGSNPVFFFESICSVFGWVSDFGDIVNPSHVWLKKLETWVGWCDNTISEGPTCH